MPAPDHSDIRTIRAAPGRRVRIPGTWTLLRAGGEAVAWGSYWQRALEEGDVEIVEAAARPDPAPDKAAAPQAKSEKAS